MGDRRWWLAGGFGLLLVAWTMGSPLIGAPDETAHYYKALGAAHGEWTGSAVAPVTTGMDTRDRFLTLMSRYFRLDPAYAVQTGEPGERLECPTFKPGPAACQYHTVGLPPVRTPVVIPGVWDGPAPTGPPPISGLLPSYVGSYPPFVYLPMGLAARLTGGGTPGLRVARAASALVCLGLLVGAVRCSRQGAAAVGLLLAATPMTFFLAGSITTSGMEIAAGLCAFAAAFAIVGGAREREPWLWFGVGGSVLAASRVLGPVWAAYLVAVPCALLGRHGLLVLWRSHRRRMVGAGAVLLVSAGATALWDVLAVPRVHAGPGAVRGALGPAVRHLPGLARQGVGVFGWIDTPMPRAAYALALLAMSVVGVLALWVGTRRQRLVLAGTAITALVATVAVEAFTQTPYGFVSQGRYTLAVAVATPLLSAHILVERGARAPALLLGAALAGAALVASLLQVTGWYAQAHHYSVGLAGPRNFLAAPAWSPPGGWAPWVLCAVAGSAMLAYAGWLSVRPSLSRSGRA
ncbi:MAG: DUF2142 domain-containing protein [Actinomycetota bacterium]|nr:DUF2142 domain-containing protein [Actinomycetota bacterium]